MMMGYVFDKKTNVLIDKIFSKDKEDVTSIYQEDYDINVTVLKFEKQFEENFSRGVKC